MKTLLLATLLALFPFSLHAEEKEPLMDFTLPVPAAMSQEAAKALKARKMPLREYFQMQGIAFPEGSKIDLNAEKHILMGRLPHLEALRMVQIVAMCAEDDSGNLIKEIFDPSLQKGVHADGFSIK